MNWETERMRDIHNMQDHWAKPGVEPFRVTERVKAQAPLKLSEATIPQWTRGTVKAVDEGRVQVDFGAAGTHWLSSENASRFLLHERQKSPTDTFREQLYRDFRREGGYMESGFKPGTTVLDENWDPLLVSGNGPRGLKVEVTTPEGATFIRASAGLIEAEMDQSGQKVVIKDIDPDNHLRHYPVNPGEELSLVGSTAQIQYGFVPVDGRTVYRVLTQYGPKDLSDQEVQLMGESVDESRVLGLATQDSMGVCGGAIKLTPEQVAPHSPGTRITVSEREGTVMEKFDNALMVAFDDGEIEYVGIEEAGKEEAASENE